MQYVQLHNNPISGRRIGEPPARWESTPVPHDPFVRHDPHGHVFEAQIELNQAWSMLEVLVRLCAEAGHADVPPVEGWGALLGAVQEHVGVARQQLVRWRNDASGG